MTNSPLDPFFKPLSAKVMPKRFIAPEGREPLSEEAAIVKQRKEVSAAFRVYCVLLNSFNEMKCTASLHFKCCVFHLPGNRSKATRSNQRYRKKANEI